MDGINEKILSLWEESREVIKQIQGDEKILAPLLYPDLEKNSILFIGLNPSFSKAYLRKKLCKGKDSDVEDFFSFEKRKENEEEWINFEETAKRGDSQNKHYFYYKKFDEIKKCVNKNMNSDCDWEHIDLFLYRETTQKDLVKKFRLPKHNDIEDIKNGDIKNFLKKQLCIAGEIISDIDPCIIVVVNARAAKIFDKYFKPVWRDDLGCYFTEIDSRCIQTHLTGMLSGQRALDNESFKSLKWLIRHAFLNWENIEDAGVWYI
jgi:hypothetical protein